MAPEQKPILRFTRLSRHAFIPTKGSKQAAGYDLKSAHKHKVPARDMALIKTDLKIELPPGCYGRVAPRSGLTLRHRIDVGAGVIDADYRGSVSVVLFNHSDVDFIVKKGDRIAQLICERIVYPVLEETNDMTETFRSSDGFGSTGVV